MPQLVEFEGSPNVFDLDTGRYIATEAEVKALGGRTSVRKISNPRPGVKTGSDFALFEGKDLSSEELGTLGVTPTQPTPPPVQPTPPPVQPTPPPVQPTPPPVQPTPPPVQPTPPPVQPTPPQQTVDSNTLYKVITGSTDNGKPIYNVFLGDTLIDEPNDPRLKNITIEDLPDRPGGAPEGFVDEKFEPAPGAIPPEEGEEAPRVFHDFDAYKNLSDDDKLFVDEMFRLVQFGGEQEAQIFANAIEQAKGIADPFFKAKLGLALAETVGKIAEVTGDFETQKEVLERARDELLEDVRLGREFFTLEQQADIARVTNSYQTDILQIADIAAEKGLTLATGARSRELAESRRSEQFGDVVESSTRRHNLQIKELELRASRGETDAARRLESLQSQRTLRLESIGRGAEELLGTGALTGVSGLGGFTPVGGVLGDIEEKKRRSLISDTAAFVELQRGFL